MPFNLIELDCTYINNNNNNSFLDWTIWFSADFLDRERISDRTASGKSSVRTIQIITQNYPDRAIIRLSRL